MSKALAAQSSSAQAESTGVVNQPICEADRPTGLAAEATAVVLADAQRVLALFTQGLAGRYLHLKQVKLAAGTFRPEAINTDGTSVYLPPLIDAFATRRENFAMYRIAVLHQLGYFENGTFDFTLPQLRERLMSEGAHELPTHVPVGHIPVRGVVRHIPDLERFVGLWAAPILMRKLLVTFEDLRVDRAMRQRYPGARKDLQQMLAMALSGRPELQSLSPIAALLEALVQFSLGASSATLLAQHPSQWLTRMLDAARRVASDDATVYDSALAAIDCYRLIEQAARVSEDAAWAAEAQQGADGAAMSQAGGDDGSSDEPQINAAELDEQALSMKAVDFRGELVPEIAQRAMLAGSSGSQSNDADGSSNRDRLTAPRETAARSAESATASSNGQRAPSLDDEPRSYLYDEWDYHQKTYLKGWCRLYEHRLRGDDVEFIRDVRRRHALLAQQVKRRFRMIRPESWQRQHRVSDGDELDLDGMIESVIDRHTGHASDETVYVRRHRGLREVAAAFLLDMSASTDFPIPDPIAKASTKSCTENSAGNAPGNSTETSAQKIAQPADDVPQYLYGGMQSIDESEAATPKRRVIDVAKESLALMGDALHALGDSHAIYGFSGDGREQVDFYVAKDFGDPPSARTWAALGAMKPKRSTRMGPAIRHALSKLNRHAMKRKVLIIVSDGYPQDHDYGPERSDEEYGIQDTASALREAERDGVQTFCITIDPAGHDYLRRMCEGQRYLVIEDVADLPEELSKVYRALTFSNYLTQRP